MDIGEVSAGQKKFWTCNLTSLGFLPYEIPDNVTSADHWATCEDQH